MSELAFAEMFSGVGGFRLGLERSGWKCVWANDIDKYANQVYKKKFGSGELVEGDIRQVDAKTIPNHTLLTAGFPCQAFSVAGKRKGTGEGRGTLFTHIARVASAKRPKLLLLENVKGILSSDAGRTFAVILRTLANLGYLLEWQVLNSKHFGVPQNRERVFIIGHSREASSRQIFPIREASALPIGKAESESESWEASTLEASYGKNKSLSNMVVGSLTEGGHSGGLHSQMAMLSHSVRSGGKGSVDRHSWDLVVHTTQPRSGNPKKGGTGPLSRSDGITYALDCPNSQVIEKNTKIRRLTPTECERLQGFPDGWTEGVSDTQRYKLLGNAVTVNVVEFLGEKLKQSLEGGGV